MLLVVLSTVLSTVALLAAITAVIRVAADRRERGRVLLALKQRVPRAELAEIERRVTELATECASDRTALSKVADRLHRLAGRVQGLQRAEDLNADPQPASRDELRSALLKGHHALGPNHE